MADLASSTTAGAGHRTCRRWRRSATRIGGWHVPACSPPDLLARCTFPPPGTHVTWAVSGGADSAALLILAVAAGCTVEAVHVDHGLRRGSDREAAVVADLAATVGATFRADSVTVPPGPNLE